MIIEQINEKLGKINIEALAYSSKFQIKSKSKLNAQAILSGFMYMILDKGKSLTDLAFYVLQASGIKVSETALDKRLSIRHEQFGKDLLNETLKQSLEYGMKIPTKLLSNFGKVYVEDSTCVSLCPQLAESFAGPHSSRGPSATFRVQLRTDLKTGSLEDVSLHAYRAVDQGFASDILSEIQANELVLRDRGYWSMDAIKGIINKKAFFISRMQSSTNIYDKELNKVDLLQLLTQNQKKGQTVTDIEVLLSKKEKLPVRLVAIQVPQNVYQSRRRKALKDRSASANHSEDYLDLLQWSIFVTNCKEDQLKAEEILEVYALRWRIETIFKCWKSHFNFDDFFSTKKSLTESQVRIYFSFFLVFILLWFVRLTNYFTEMVLIKHNKLLSIQKFAQRISFYIERLWEGADLEHFVDEIAHFCTYEERQDRVNMLERLYLLNKS